MVPVFLATQQLVQLVVWLVVQQVYNKSQ